MTEQAAAPALSADDASPGGGDDGLLYVLFMQNYGRLVRFATVVSGSLDRGEDAVQEAFARLFARPRRLRDRAAAEAYLRSAVLNAARTHQRRRDRERPTDGLPGRSHEPTPAGRELAGQLLLCETAADPRPRGGLGFAVGVVPFLPGTRSVAAGLDAL